MGSFAGPPLLHQRGQNALARRRSGQHVADGEPERNGSVIVVAI